MNLLNSLTKKAGEKADSDQVLQFLSGDTNELRFRTNDMLKANLRNVGFRLAGLTRASLIVLETAMSRIDAATILEAQRDKNKVKKYKQKLENEILEVDEKITSIKQEIAQAQTNQEKHKNVHIPKLEKQINELNEERDQLAQEISEQKDAVKSNPFHRWFFWLLFGFGTIYVYCFYASASYSAIFRGVPEAVVNGDSLSDLQMAFNTIFAPEFISSINFHWLIPFGFLIIGAILHRAMEASGRQKIVQLPIALSFILIADALLAYGIEKKIKKIEYFVGQAESPDYLFFTDAIVDPEFYLILVLGSLTVFCWSYVVSQVSSLYSDLPALKAIRTSKRQIKKKIKRLNKKISRHRADIKDIDSQIERMQLKIDHLEHEKTNIRDRKNNVVYSPSMIKNNLLAFYQGWMQFVSNLQHSNLEKRTEKVFKTKYAQITDMHLEDEPDMAKSA